MDRTVQTVKNNLGRMNPKSPSKDGVDKATDAYNNTSHTALSGAEPSEVRGSENLRWI